MFGQDVCHINLSAFAMQSAFKIPLADVSPCYFWLSYIEPNQSGKVGTEGFSKSWYLEMFSK